MRGFAWACLIAGAIGLAPVSSAAPPRRSYWLSVELLGPEDARSAALAELRQDPDPVDPPAGVPGAVVGRAETIQEAVRWVATEVFDGAPLGAAEEATLLREPTAPVPGRRILATHGAYLASMIITGAGENDQVRRISWPRNAAEVLPDDSPWTDAQLVPARAPLFAAPSPTIPPARERHAIAHRGGGLYRLGVLDRCAGAGPDLRCLRWVQVVARSEDEFVGGYLPAFMVADPNAWVRGRTQFPAAQLVNSAVVDGQAQLVLLAFAADGTRHQKVLEVPLVDGRYPTASLGLAGQAVTLEIEGAPPVRLDLSADLDRYPRARN